MHYIQIINSCVQEKYRATINTTVPSKLSKKDDLIDVLSGAREAPTPANTTASAKTPIKAVVQSAFLNPLKGESAELCKLGHKMKPIYGKQLLDNGKGGITLEDGSVLVVEHLFRAGLVQKRG